MISFFLCLRKATGVRHALEEIGRGQHTGRFNGDKETGTVDHLEIPDRNDLSFLDSTPRTWVACISNSSDIVLTLATWQK